MNKNMQLYEKYFLANQSDRPDLFRALKEHYAISSAVYPGSFVHVTPSLILPRVVYIDSDRRVQAFFDNPAIKEWVQKNKEYEEEPDLQAFQQNYTKPLPANVGVFDLLISQYAGFVSQECKRYLKINGILLVNNSHADAGLAFLDPDYRLIAAMDHRSNSWKIIEDNISEYFIPKTGTHPTKAELEQTMRGVGYKKSAANYVFRRIS